MRTKVVMMAVLAALILSASAALAQYGAAGADEEPFLRAKIGLF